MTEQQAKNALREFAETLKDGGQTFCLALKTGDSYLIINRFPEEGDFFTYLPNVYRFNAEFDADSASDHTLTTFRKVLPHYRTIFEGTVKSSNGVCSLVINDGVADWEVEFREGTDEYLRNKIKVGDYLKLNVIVLVLFSPKKEYIIFDTADILEHRRTVTLKG